MPKKVIKRCVRRAASTIVGVTFATRHRYRIPVQSFFMKPSGAPPPPPTRHTPHPQQAHARREMSRCVSCIATPATSPFVVPVQRLPPALQQAARGAASGSSTIGRCMRHATEVVRDKNRMCAAHLVLCNKTWLGVYASNARCTTRRVFAFGARARRALEAQQRVG